MVKERVFVTSHVGSGRRASLLRLDAGARTVERSG